MIGLSFVLAVAVIFVVARHEDICRKPGVNELAEDYVSAFLDGDLP